MQPKSVGGCSGVIQPPPGSHVPAVPFELTVQSGGCGAGQQFGSMLEQPHCDGSFTHGSWHVLGSIGSAHGGGGGGGHIRSPGAQLGGGQSPLASHQQYGSAGSMHGGGGGGQLGSVEPYAHGSHI
jgi:hypothetical protein